MVRMLFIGSTLFLGLLMLALARTAAMSDRQMEDLHKLELLGREEEQNGDQSEEVKTQS